MSEINSSLVIIKPDAFQRRLASTILSEFEEEGLVLDFLYIGKLKREGVEYLYEQYKNVSHYINLEDFMLSGKVLCVRVIGANAIEKCRSKVQTIRNKYADKFCLERNLIHSSDSVESADRELRFFLLPAILDEVMEDN